MAKSGIRMRDFARHVADFVDIEGDAQGQLATSTSGAHTAALTEGIYDIWATADSASDVTTSTGYLLRANQTIPFFVTQGNKIGAILASGSDTLRYHRVA
jgi:hypothetical protein